MLKRLSKEEFNCNERAYPFADSEGWITVDATSVRFRGQHGPAKEVGVNGCQIDSMIEFARLVITAYNEKFPCRENSVAITKLEEAEMWLQRRHENRIARNVEGKSEV